MVLLYREPLGYKDIRTLAPSKAESKGNDTFGLDKMLDLSGLR